MLLKGIGTALRPLTCFGKGSAGDAHLKDSDDDKKKSSEAAGKS